jgi:hypothetical protein
MRAQDSRAETGTKSLLAHRGPVPRSGTRHEHQDRVAIAQEYEPSSFAVNGPRFPPPTTKANEKRTRCRLELEHLLAGFVERIRLPLLIGLALPAGMIAELGDTHRASAATLGFGIATSGCVSAMILPAALDDVERTSI